jgi:hypothetical protein
VAQRRRQTLMEQRIEVADALRSANEHAVRFRTPVHRMLECARQLAGLSTSDLWLRYLALGGNLELDRFHRALRGVDELGGLDADLIVTALNEHFRDAGFGSPLSIRRATQALSPSARPPSAPPGSG